MFEKEASEYTDKRIIPIQQVSETDLYNAFIDGAEFGYNKAKEEDNCRKIILGNIQL